MSYLRTAWAWFNENRWASTRDLPWPARALSLLVGFVVIVVVATIGQLVDRESLVVWVVAFLGGLVAGFAALDAVASALRRRKISG